MNTLYDNLYWILLVISWAGFGYYFLTSRLYEGRADHYRHLVQKYLVALNEKEANSL